MLFLRLACFSLLLEEQVTGVGVLQAVPGHQGRSTNAAGNKALTELVNALGELVVALEAGGVPVARPEALGEGSGTRPHLAIDDRGIRLLGPHGDLGTDDELGLGDSQVEGEIVVVNALPSLVRRAPRTTTSTKVEVRGVRVGVHVDVVPLIVSDPATETTVEVEPVGRTDDYLMAQTGHELDILGTVVPGLKNNTLVNILGVKTIVGLDNILPHDDMLLL